MKVLREEIIDGRSVTFVKPDPEDLVPIEPPKANFQKFRNISKRRLMDAFKKRGVWDQVKQWINSSEFSDYWTLSTTLEEQDPDMQKAIEDVKAAFGLSDDDIDVILDESIADI